MEQGDDDGQLPVVDPGSSHVEAVDVHRKEGKEVRKEGDWHGRAGEARIPDEIYHIWENVFDTIQKN